jgi:large subunit ribosomal protein L21
MEFAVIQTGGKQYKVASGDVLKIEKMTGSFKVGDKVTFDKVLLVEGTTDAIIGTPFVAGKTIEATLQEVGRNKTVDVIKYKQKSRYFKKNGHRQPWFKVKIGSIK